MRQAAVTIRCCDGCGGIARQRSRMVAGTLGPKGVILGEACVGSRCAIGDVRDRTVSDGCVFSLPTAGV